MSKEMILEKFASGAIELSVNGKVVNDYNYPVYDAEPIERKDVQKALGKKKEQIEKMGKESFADKIVRKKVVKADNAAVFAQAVMESFAGWRNRRNAKKGSGRRWSVDALEFPKDGGIQGFIVDKIKAKDAEEDFKNNDFLGTKFEKRVAEGRKRAALYSEKKRLQKLDKLIKKRDRGR